MFERIRTLFAHTTVYGLGDVATSLLSLLLLPIFTRHLTPEDYGVIALLVTVEAGVKVVFRWGVDHAFIRLFYDCADLRARQRLASSIFLFLVAADGALLAIGLLAAPAVAVELFGTAAHAGLLRLVVVNTFVIGFFFIPFALLRIEGRAVRYATVTFSRALLTILCRLLLVAVLGLGVRGFVLADLVVTAVYTVILGRWCMPLIRLTTSGKALREALRFGLPLLPNACAHQVIALNDRFILSRYATVGDVGVYAIGATLGVAVKYFLGAFQIAWAPFTYEMMDRTDARETYCAVTTYAFLVLVLLAAGLTATANDLIRLMTVPDYHGAARVVPWIAVGAVMQGVYQLTSVGLSIRKRTRYYPLATGLTLVCSVGANLVLIPRFGFMGAAYANAFAFTILAAAGTTFSQRQYSIPYEWSRLLRIVVAGLASCGLASSVPLGEPGAAASLLARGALVVVLYPAALAAQGFFRRTEIARIVETVRVIGRCPSRLRRSTRSAR